MLRHAARSIAAACAAAAVFAPVASAQKYPEKPIRLIVPFPPGGNIDITARTISPGLSEMLGVALVVENRGGASGTIGVDLTAKAPPDGYTLVVGSTGTITGAPSLYPKLPYNPVRDLAAISMVNDVPLVIVVHPALRARNMKELIALAKQQPGRMTMGSPGAGSTNHLAGEVFQLATGAQFTHVPYKGSGPALVDLMGGQIDLIFDQLTASIGYIRSGKLRAIGITQTTRSSQVPDIPTLLEQGCKGCEANTFTGLFAPGATPKAIIDRLADVTAKVIASKAVQDRFTSMGAEPKSNTPEEFTQFVRNDIARWAKVIKEAGIKLE
ncbi:MAG: tripartite tricarboxylate transporter substrate binding protein [Burkholderiales bacterium]|nr:tripartite tricarboxylate transporter substrate binding protein [Burkholderiales bacterium]